jgi:flagellar biosynthetic protein FlhB
VADRPGGEPTEEPTPKRLEEARKKGEIARSRDLSGAAVFAAAVVALTLLGSSSLGHLLALMHTALRRAVSAAPPPGAPPLAMWPVAGASLGHALSSGLSAALPLLAACVAAAVLVGAAQARGLLTLYPVTPRLDKLDPGAGLKRLFSGQQLVELAKSLLVMSLLLYLGVQVLKNALGRLVNLPRAAAGKGALAVLGEAQSLTDSLLSRALLVLVVVGIADYGLAWRRQRKQLMMTREEVKREHKESEGDPHHKAERQRVHRELVEGQMLDEVRLADLVIVNPVQIAVALRYDAQRMEAPQVVARGERVWAARIREEARKHGVPVLRNVPLARALVGLEVGATIPADLYEAVAEVLRFVYSLGQRGGAAGAPSATAPAATSTAPSPTAPPAGRRV